MGDLKTMKVRVADENKDAEQFIPPAQPDGSRIGINYADAYLKVLKTTLEHGRKVVCKRRGLKITLTIGDKKGEGLMRRLDHGPDVKVILQNALQDAAKNAGAEFSVEDGALYLDTP